MDPFEIGKQLGAIAEAQRTLSEKMDGVGDRVGAIEATLAKTVQPQLAELMAFKGRTAQIVIAAAGVATGGLTLVWQGLAHYWSDILAVVTSLLQARRAS